MVALCGESHEIDDDPQPGGDPIRVLFVIALTMIPLTAQAHTRPELEVWLHEWTQQADNTLTPELTA